MTGNEVKKYLRENGIDTNNISIRIDRGCYSKAVRITLNDLSLNLQTIKETVDTKYGLVRRCKRTHEILEGGNTYVLVSYDFDLLESISKGV